MVGGWSHLILVVHLLWKLPFSLSWSRIKHLAVHLPFSKSHICWAPPPPVPSPLSYSPSFSSFIMPTHPSSPPYFYHLCRKPVPLSFQKSFKIKKDSQIFHAVFHSQSFQTASCSVLSLHSHCPLGLKVLFTYQEGLILIIFVYWSARTRF